MSAEIMSQIEDVLEQIRPALHADGGDVELVEFDEEGFVHLTMMGSCGGCPMSTPRMIVAPADPSAPAFPNGLPWLRQS